ncbi:glycoside hydrolase superfamily [Fusarium oxysporum f. sp. albedinis]|nr:glycoside hydrolase superfamily [Fusarium oxysporum f. sp. albedinis]KAK2471137.1 hypothetical protein H9L39_17368 [Fusarium oxysporum f. sp. albedinis]
MPSFNILSASLVGLLGLGGANAQSYAAPPSYAASFSSSGLVASTYFAGFHANRGFPLEAMQWDKFTDVKYAFAETAPDGKLDLSASEPDLLPSFVSAAKQNGVKALLSIGGWTGSRHFSTSFGSAKNRTAFVEVCLDYVKQYELDGLDFDWEYPNRQGLGCNDINQDDTANFLQFLKELRSHPEGKNLYLTAAGSLLPWNNDKGVSSTDLDGFAEVLDYLMVMNYDLYGAWAPTAGPNAPLASKCDSRNTAGSAEEAVSQWSASGIPKNQIVLGVPAYGHGFSVNRTSALGNTNCTQGTNAQFGPRLALYPPQNSTDRFQGSSWDNDPAIDSCGNPNPPGGTYTFWSLITEAGFLDVYGNPAPGIMFAWDNCSKTPALYDEKREIYVNYDNALSFYEKGKFVVEHGLGGFATYEAGGDFNNILINSIRSAVGLS